MAHTTTHHDLTKPLPLYSKVMRKYVVQTSIGLLRKDIKRFQCLLAEKEAQLEKELDGVAHYGDVTLKPSDVFIHDHRCGGDCIDDPREWEDLLTHFVNHGASDIEELVHTLRTRTNVIKHCQENSLPLPPGY